MNPDQKKLNDMLHGTCECGSSRIPVDSDKKGFNKLQCESCDQVRYENKECFGDYEPKDKNMNISEIQVGNKIKFSNDRSWFTVQARNDRFIICNAVQKNNTWHTIIDLEKNIRGDDNMVLHSGYDNQQECEARLIQFEKNEIEISHRNNIPLEIITVI